MQVSGLVGPGLYRELAPVLTALLFIGRAGSMKAPPTTMIGRLRAPTL